MIPSVPQEKTMPQGWTRQHWRNRDDAQTLRDQENPYTNPWYVLMRYESDNGDSISVGYTDEEMSQYVLALNGIVQGLHDTKQAVREATTELERQCPLVSHDDEDLDYNEGLRYVSLHNHELPENPDKSDVRAAIEEIQRDRDKVYDIDSVEPETDEEDDEE